VELTCQRTGFSHQSGNRAKHARQFLGPNNKNGHNTNHQKFLPTEVEHTSPHKPG